MNNDLNLRRMPAGTTPADRSLQTRANTIVKAADHGTPLELSNITIRYGGGKGGADAVSVVEGFDLTLHAGEMHCVAGRSGSGKTSILTVGAGLTLPTSGRVLWEGDSLESMGDDEIADRRRALIGYVDQGGALIDGMSALGERAAAGGAGRRGGPARVTWPRTCWTSWASAAACGTVPRSSPAVSASAWPSPAP